MTSKCDELLQAQHDALYAEDKTDKENLDAYYKVVTDAIAEGFCPMDGYRLTPGRTCHNPAFCGCDGGSVAWDRDGTARMNGRGE